MEQVVNQTEQPQNDVTPTETEEFVSGSGGTPLLNGFRNKTVILPLAHLQKNFERLEKLVGGGFNEFREQNTQQLQHVYRVISEQANQVRELALTLEAVIKVLNLDTKTIDETEESIKVEKAREVEASNDAKAGRTTVNRPAALGDVVKINFVGKIDGTAFPGGTGKDQHLTLGSGQFIPGFEDQLLGMSANETKTVQVTFPAEYGNKDLAGKGAEFETTVVAVKSQTKNDEEKTA